MTFDFIYDRDDDDPRGSSSAFEKPPAKNYIPIISGVRRRIASVSSAS